MCVCACMCVCVSLSMPAAPEFSACVYHSVCVCVSFRSPDNYLQPIQVAAAPLDRERAHPLWQGILQCVAVCCSVLQCVAVQCWIASERIHFGKVYCSVLQCVAACCSTMLDRERIHFGKVGVLKSQLATHFTVSNDEEADF